jgi:hypothetical protein
MKYLIKLNNKIISRRNTIRTYNYGWVRVVQKEEKICFYKNTGETITVKNCLSKHYPKTIVLNGQQVNQMTVHNQHEKDSLSFMDYMNHIDKSKTVTKKLNDTYTFNECSKYLSDTWKNWTQNNLLFSEIGKFSEPENGVRTLEFNS